MGSRAPAWQPLEGIFEAEPFDPNNELDEFNIGELLSAEEEDEWLEERGRPARSTGGLRASRPAAPSRSPGRRGGTAQRATPGRRPSTPVGSRPRRPIFGVGPYASQTLISTGPLSSDPLSGSPTQPVEPGDPQNLNCEPAVVLDGFDKGDYRIKTHHYPLLDAFLKKLSGLGPHFGSTAIVGIGGHTDNTGTTAINEGLSLNRAFEVERFLTNLAGDLRAQVSGFGSARSIAPNTTEAGKRRNRRVELTLCRANASQQGRR